MRSSRVGSVKRGGADLASKEDEHTDPRVSLAAGRTHFAMYRTQLAPDRTTLAWIRTALTFATFGFGMVGFFRALRQRNNNPVTTRLHEGAGM